MKRRVLDFTLVPLLLFCAPVQAQEPMGTMVALDVNIQNAADTYTLPESFYQTQNNNTVTPSAPVAPTTPTPANSGTSKEKKTKAEKPKKEKKAKSENIVVVAPQPSPAPAADSGNAATVETAGYDGGFFIKDKNGKFSFTLNGRIQPRAAVSVISDPQTNTGALDKLQWSFVMRRVTFVWGGSIINPKLTWEVVLIPMATPGIGEAIVVYTFNPQLAVSVGYQTIPTTHTQMESSGKLQLPDWSLASQRYNTGDSIGIVTSGTIGRFYYSGGGFNGPSTDLARNKNNEAAYGLQLAYTPLGTYDSASEPDYDYSPDPNWVIEADGNYHHEESGTQAKVIHGTFFTGLKWHGLGALMEGNFRYTDPDQFTREQIDLGYTVQAGYFFIPKKFEVAVRTSGLLDDINNIGINQNMTAGNIGGLDGNHTGVDLNGDSNNEYEYSIAFNYYFAKNNIKMQAQYSYILDGVPTSTKSRIYNVGLIQGQFGF